MKKTAKSLLVLLCVISMLLWVPSVLNVQAEQVGDAPAAGLDLETMQIVVPAEPTMVENTAAKELRDYIKQITGKELQIANEGANAGAAVYVGATQYAAQKGVQYPTEGDTKGEAWAIQTVEGNVVLVGAPARGVLYAAYHLLEDVLGVRWWNLWEEYVPSGKALVPRDYADSGVPAMEYREIFVGNETEKDYPFYVRNRINGNTTHIPSTHGGYEQYGYPAHVHTFARYFSESDFSAHPEWFSMDENGKRVYDRQLCLSNPGLKAEFSKRMLERVAANPERIYAVCPNDNKYLCDCPDCRADIQTYGSSGYVLNFVNEMARALVAAGYPDTPVEMLVYWVYVDEPKGGVTPDDNVTIRYADNYTDLLHGINHVNNTKSKNTLEKWTKISSNDFYYWQYVVNYRENGIFPSMFHYGEDFTTLMEMGVNGWFAEQEQCINVDFWDMKLWLIAKLMEKPVTGQEYAALMDEFIYGYYGEEAGQYIREYLYYMNEKAQACYENQNFGTYIIQPTWLDVRDMIKGNELFEKAFAAAGDDWTLQRRLRTARCGFDRVAYHNFSRWEDQADAFGLELPFTKRELGERIFLAMDEQIAIRGSYDIDYMMFFPQYDQYSENLSPLPLELEDVAREHIIEITCDDFRLTDNYQIVNDSASLIGKAVRADAAARSGKENPLILRDGGCIDFALYNPNGEQEITLISRILAEDVVAGEGYHLYKFDMTVPYIGRNAYVYLFTDWGVQTNVMAEQLKDLEGKTVEIYLSMKVEGTVDGSDPSDLPVYYVDRMFVLPDKEQQNHNYVNDDQRGRSVCQICGDVILYDPVAGNQEDPRKIGEMMMWYLVGGIAEVGCFAFLLYFILGKRKKRKG